MITLNINSPWNVCTPTLFRFMEREFVDQFFHDGSLRISSFKQFREHKDEQRLDKFEGDTYCALTSSQNGGQTIEAKVRHGKNAYVLCAAMRFDKELMKSFEQDSYIRINDPTKFGMVISRHVPGFVAGYEGPCLYQENKIINKDIDYIGLDAFRSSTGQIDMSRVNSFIDREMDFIPYFLKERSYAHQIEYRMLWLTNSDIEDFMDIKVPEAVQFCTRPKSLTE